MPRRNSPGGRAAGRGNSVSAPRAPVAQFAGDGQRGREVIARFVETGQAVVDHAEVAQDDALQAGVPKSRATASAASSCSRASAYLPCTWCSRPRLHRMLPSSCRFPTSRATASAASSCDRALSMLPVLTWSMPRLARMRPSRCPVPRLPGQRKRLLELHPSLVWSDQAEPPWCRGCCERRSATSDPSFRAQ